MSILRENILNLVVAAILDRKELTITVDKLEALVIEAGTSTVNIVWPVFSDNDGVNDDDVIIVGTCVPEE